MPPKPRQNGCRQVLLHWTFSDERLSHWHDIHDSVLTWCPCAGSTYILASRQRSQRFDVEDSTFFSWQTNLQPLFASKAFCELHFFMYSICQCYLVLVQFGWNSSTKQYANCPVCECFCRCPWTHFHKSTPALCNASFGQFRLRKVGCNGSWPQHWHANPERSMPWHPWHRPLRWQVHSENML